MSSALLFLSAVPAPHHGQLSAAFSSEGGCAFLITEFYPAALNQDEYVVISQGSSAAASLAGFRLTDGEGSIVFASGQLVPPSGSLSVSMNATAFAAAFGHAPTLDLQAAKANGTVAVSGTFRLSDTGDSLALVAPGGEILDFVKYGTNSESSGAWSGEPVPLPRPGEVCRRVGATVWRDTDSAADWFPFREYKYGFTEFAPLEANLMPGELTAFVSPDCSLSIVLETVEGAERSIRLSSYELSSSAVCTALLEAVVRGVQVRILVDGAPAGGMSEAEIVCLSALSDAGAVVETVCGNLSEKVVQHIGPLHCKYMVVDSARSIILSENFVESGLPIDKLEGNRGWGVSISSPLVSAYLASVFDSDSRSTRPDVFEWSHDRRFLRDAVIPAPLAGDDSPGALTPLRIEEEAQVTLIVSPDGSPEAPFLARLLRGAASLDIEQFQVDLMWEDRWTKGAIVSPLLVAVSGAMDDGAAVRMIFDSSWFNAETNQPAMDYMVSSAKDAPRVCEFRTICNGTPISVVHNKGAIIDGSEVLISSNNWGRSSFARNRELAVLVRSSGAATYFGRAFDMDWDPDTTAPVAEAGDDVETQVGRHVVLNGSLSSDDRVVANYSWDLDGDGRGELFGRLPSLCAHRAGVTRITLVVTDAWGNTAADSMQLRVAERTDLQSPAPKALPLVLFAAGMTSAAIGGLAAGLRSRSRKVNHRRPPDW